MKTPIDEKAMTQKQLLPSFFYWFEINQTI